MDIRRKLSCYSSFPCILRTFYLADGDTARCQPRSSIATSDNLKNDSDVEIENLIENNGSDTTKATNNLVSRHMNEKVSAVVYLKKTVGHVTAKSRSR